MTTHDRWVPQPSPITIINRRNMLRRAYASLGLKVGCVWQRVPGGKPAREARRLTDRTEVR